MFVFHPGMEFAHLRSSKSIKDMTSSEVSELRFVNQDGVPTEHKVSLLDEVFDLFKGRCIINVDKFWTAMLEITACIRRHGMEDQVIVKTSADEKWFSMVEEIAPELPYMPIIGKKGHLFGRFAGRGRSISSVRKSCFTRKATKLAWNRMFHGCTIAICWASGERDCL